jgi:hypothetical protein
MSQIVTKTMAEILMQQGHIEEAYQIFKTLSEKDPSDMEIKEKLKELSEKIGPLSPGQSIPATEERVRTLEKWLANIRERKKA